MVKIVIKSNFWGDTMSENTLMILGLVLIVAVAVFFLMPKPNPEEDIVRFFSETMNKNYAVRFSDVTGDTPYEEAAAKVYFAELLAQNKYDIADRGKFFKTRWEEQALADLGLVKDLYFEKPEMARYSLAIEVLKDSFKITVADLLSVTTYTKTFGFPEKYRKLLSSVQGISPRVVEVKQDYEQRDLVINAIVNYPFTEKVSVSANGKTYGVYTVTSEAFRFKIQNVKPGEVYDVNITPLDRRNKSGQVFSRRLIVELPPEPVISMSTSISGGKITYTWTHPNLSYPELKFIVDTLLGRYTTTAPALTEELRYGRLYNVKITAVGKYGQSETKSFVVKTPPDKPSVRADVYFDTIKLYITNTNDYDVKYLISIDGKTYETNKNYFEYKVSMPGILYKVEVQAVDGSNYSQTVSLNVQTKTPMYAPKVKAEIVSGTLVVNVDKITAIDLKEYSIIINGKEVSRSNQYVENAQPDMVYDIRVKWINKDNDQSPETRVVLETFPLQPDVVYSQSGKDLIIDVKDPSKNVKAESFEVIVDGKTYKTTGRLVLENFANGKTYTVFVHAIRGSYKTPAKIIQIPTISNIIPAPTLKTYTVLENIVTLEWDAQLPFDFLNFRIVRKMGNEEKIYQSAVNKFTDTGMPNGKAITYTITTVNKAGIQSQPLTLQIKSFPEKPKVSYKYDNGKVTFTFENQNEYEVEYKVERSGQEIYKGKDNTFTDTVKADGSMYFYKVYALSGTIQSKPVELMVTAYAPLTAPKVNVSRSGESIIITVVRPDSKDYKESYLEINGVTYKTEVFSLKNEPDKVYNVKAYWVNTSGDKSPSTELTIETSPKPPIVEYKLENNRVTLKISDPSSVLKAEKFVILYGASRFETTKNEISIDIDTSKMLHEFKVYSMYKENSSPQTSVIVVVK